ncbi:sensor histidine kinase [Spirillospora sp. CA-294931]|uniref:sensor histidine kinase n=1 Tax=Spirillospora sp. CA-294931 TaxID=3240042 RepID=UPI003D945AF3
MPRLPRNGLALATDAMVLILALGAAFAMVTERGTIVRPYGGATLVVALALALTLLWRRRAPITVAWVNAVPAAVVLLVELASPGVFLRQSGDISVDPLLFWPPGAPLVAYAAISFGRSPWARWIPVVLLALVAALIGEALPETATREVVGQDSDTGEALVFRSVVLIVIGALLGLYVAARRRVVEGLRERTERAERERHLLAEQARIAERARLAAEMHDVVAHRVTLMVLQAGALRVRAPDEATRASAEELRGTGCQALEELRDVIGLLRREVDGGDGEEPAGPLPDLSTLIDESASVGVPVELAERGDPPLASPVVGRTAYRIVQEALTNVRKHAPGARVNVDVRYRADGVRLTVRNSAGTGEADATLALSGSGTGLAGLRERVELIGGTFASGPSPGGGFSVEASLPAFVPTADPDSADQAAGGRGGSSPHPGQEPAP